MSSFEGENFYDGNDGEKGIEGFPFTAPENKMLFDFLEFELNHHDGPLCEPTDAGWCRVGDVKKHCLSKQRVKETILNLRSEAAFQGDCVSSYLTALIDIENALLKEK